MPGWRVMVPLLPHAVPQVVAGSGGDMGRRGLCARPVGRAVLALPGSGSRLVMLQRVFAGGGRLRNRSISESGQRRRFGAS